jgi:hypothetical protein
MAKNSRAHKVGRSNSKKEDRPNSSKKGDRLNAANKQDRAPITKDTEEEELERLVFGDIPGFKAGLRIPPGDLPDDRDLSDASSQTVDAEDGPGKDLRALRDDEVGFFPRTCIGAEAGWRLIGLVIFH